MTKSLTAKFGQAAQFAARAHSGQVRKGSGTPYIGHPIAVASLVLEYGGNEAQAIGALLHDVIEDCDVTAATLEKQFGKKVARIVVECSDYFGPANARKPAWRARKETYIEQLAHVSGETLLVSAADKLHNARSIVHDAKHHGKSIWKRFSAKPPEILWYYQALLQAYRKRRHASLAVILLELELAIAELARAAKRA